MINTLPPVAQKKAYKYSIHGCELVDSYHWLRDFNWPKVQDKSVLDHLKSENSYAEEFFKPKKELLEKLYKECIGRIQLADVSVPMRDKNYYYYTITKEKSDYSIQARKKEGEKEEIILDKNKEAKGEKYFRVGSMSISPDENLMAYSVDTKGDEHYTLKIKNLDTGTFLNDELKNIIGGAVWNETGKGFYYTKLDDKWRANKLYYHELGTKQDKDILLYHEKDHVFRIGIGKTTDREFIILETSSNTSTEVHYIKSDDLSHKIHLYIPRKEDHLCSVDHMHGQFYVETNDKGKNFRLARTDNHKNFDTNAEEIIPHRDDVYLTGCYLYDNHLVIQTKEKGLPKISIYNYSIKDKEVVHFPDPSYSAGVSYSCSDDDGIFIGYTSMVSPGTMFKYDFSTKKLNTIKVQKIPSGYNKDDYHAERVMVPSRENGVEVPVSLVYKKSLFKKDGSNPLFLYGYGSYGHSVPPTFNTNSLSLLNRGFVYAIGHIRGGDDMGFDWYESAKFLNKRRTFNDFIDIAKFLAKKQYTSEGNIAISGGSAGGMLIGTAINEEPELFKAAIADVPFVDVLNTMLDDSLPLTPGEFEEWGNPKKKEFFEYIKSYSPYDNVKPQNYPSLYILGGLNDPRVTYWEPAKWAAKLRELKQDSNILIFETNMDTGHGGKSGRFDAYKELAKKYAFILDVFGKK
ncbi:MAG: S9 family peptidase [Alphaproteobacteria bacterium]|nr:S9 family peptidase [Alphaproteobacteria bacterium]